MTEVRLLNDATWLRHRIAQLRLLMREGHLDGVPLAQLDAWYSEQAILCDRLRRLNKRAARQRSES